MDPLSPLIDQSGPSRALTNAAQALSALSPKAEIPTATLAHIANVRKVHTADIMRFSLVRLFIIQVIPKGSFAKAMAGKGPRHPRPAKVDARWDRCHSILAPVCGGHKMISWIKASLSLDANQCSVRLSCFYSSKRPAALTGFTDTGLASGWSYQLGDQFR